MGRMFIYMCVCARRGWFVRFHWSDAKVTFKTGRHSKKWKIKSKLVKIEKSPKKCVLVEWRRGRQSTSFGKILKVVRDRQEACKPRKGLGKFVTYRNKRQGTASLRPSSRAWREWSARFCLRFSAESATAALLLPPSGFPRRRWARFPRNTPAPGIRWRRKAPQSCNPGFSRTWCRAGRNRRRCSPTHREFLRIGRNRRRVCLWRLKCYQHIFQIRTRSPWGIERLIESKLLND